MATSLKAEDGSLIRVYSSDMSPAVSYMCAHIAATAGQESSVEMIGGRYVCRVRNITRAGMVLFQVQSSVQK